MIYGVSHRVENKVRMFISNISYLFKRNVMFKILVNFQYISKNIKYETASH